MYDLPPHLQTLNAIPSSNSPPSSALNAEQEEAFWSFLNTDELFSNFGLAPQAFESKNKLESEREAKAAVETSPVTETPSAITESPEASTSASATTEAKPPVQTLESFLATFAAEESTAPVLPTSYLLGLPTASASTPLDTAAPTPAPETPAPRVTGAKRLKQMGAPQAEIEEDKRRRNTEASARFRAKKKEREMALDSRAKELEAQVATLTAEKASLEKENNLLKFIVLGKETGQLGGTASSDGLQAALAALGKRKREE